MTLQLRQRSPCRSYGDFIPISDVQLYLYGGWEIVDLLENDPAGLDFVLMTPPKAERERVA